MLYGIFGDGAMPVKVLNSTLDDLLENDGEMWVLLEGKESPTKTDQAILAWLDKNQLVYEIVVKSGTEVDEVYSAPNETYKTKGKVTAKFAELLQSHPELDDSGAKFLALYTDFDNPDDSDKGIDAIMSAIAESDPPIKTYAMNAEMVEVEPEPAAEPEPEPEPRRRTRGGAKETTTKGYTRAELEEMTPTELRAVIKSLGLNVASRQKAVLVDGILDGQKAAVEPEQEEEAPKRGRTRRSTEEEVEPHVTGFVVDGHLNGDQVFVVAHINGGIRAGFVAADKARELFEV